MNRLTCKVLIIIICHLPCVRVLAQNGINIKFYKGSTPTLLSVHLNSRNRIIFNTGDGPVNFKNTSSTDTTITRHFYIDEPTHLVYNNIVVNTTGEVYESGNLLLLPGDSVVLTNNGRTVASSTGFSQFIDSFVTIPPPDFPGSFQNLLKTLDSGGLQRIFANARSNYLANKKHITDLPISAGQKRILENFNYLLQAKQLCDIPFDKVKNTESLRLDSAYSDLLSHIEILDSINSGLSNRVYEHLIHYSAFRRGIRTKDFWLYFDKADSNIVKQPFYQPYLIYCLNQTFKNLPDRIFTLKSEKVPGIATVAAVDTVYQLASILSQTKVNYKAAKSKLNEYANGKYAFLLGEEDEGHREQRTLQSLAPVNLFDLNGRKISLQMLLNNTTANIMVLDFWASWCVPCIGDYPFLKKVKAALSSQSIRFITISIDLEKDKDAWIKRTKQLHTFNASYQYRLEDPKNSPVNKFFNLYSIPRYIVIDKKGKILEENFTRPNEPAFQRKLEDYLRAYQ